MDKTNSKKVNKKLKYGGYATLVSIIVLAILLVINLMVGSLDLKLDLTQNKMFSLSEQSYQYIDGLNKNVTIYVFDEIGKENPSVKQIVEQYSSRSKKITIEYKDPVKYPQFAKQYSQDGTDVQNGSIVVKCDSKFKLIDPSSFVNYSYDQYGQQSADSLAIEQRITSAIIYATSDKNPLILTLQGHEEKPLYSLLSSELSNQNYTIKDINLLTKDAKIDEGAILSIVSPQRDISQDEAAIIKDFLAKGGKAMFFIDILKSDMPNLASVLSAYGVGLKNVIVVEGDSNYTTTNPIYLLPEMKSHDIVNLLSSKNIPVLIPAAQAIDLLSIKKANTTIEPLLVTSTKSYGKVNLNATTSDKEASDVNGPFNLAVAITDRVSDNINTRIVLVSNGIFASTQFAESAGNIDFVINSMNWIQDRKDSISISPKSLTTANLTMSLTQQLVLSGIVVILIPAAIIIFGIVVWLRRRHQ